MMNCRLCDSATTPLGQRPDITLFKCISCGFVSGVPRHRQDATAQYQAYYRSVAPPAPEARYDEWLCRAERLLGGPGRLLEVGAGVGGFVRVAKRRGWQTFATEISATALPELGQFAEVFAGDVCDAGYPAAHFDFVVSLEVLEHLPSPLAHLREFHRVSRKDSLLLLSTPNFDGLSRRWLGLKWRVITEEHIGYFTPSLLATALRRALYSPIEIRSRTLDLSSWKASLTDELPQFNPQASATFRDQVEARTSLRLAKEGVNRVLGATGLGDSIVAWARA